MNGAVREPDGRRAREEQEHQGTRLKQLLTRRELRVLVALEELEQRLAEGALGHVQRGRACSERRVVGDRCVCAVRSEKRSLRAA